MNKLIKYHISLLLPALFLITQLFMAVSANQTIDLKGEWEYLPSNSNQLSDDIRQTKWPKMKLPTNWFLLGEKKYPVELKSNYEPLASNAPGALWPINNKKGFDYNGTIWFKKVVNLSPEENKFTLLDLDMVDYYADVYINGQFLKHHEGYFQPWSVDISPAIKEGFNEILIKVSAPTLPFDMSQQYPVSWPKNQNQVKGIFLYHDTRPGGTSWRGQERSTGGILRDIKLRINDGIDFKNVMITPTNVSKEQATLKIQYDIYNWTTVQKEVVINSEIKPFNFKDKKKPIKLSYSTNINPGENIYQKEITIKSPELWWSWDSGFPSLYQINYFVVNKNDAKSILAEGTSRFGIRSIKKDSNWIWYLNGKKLYIRGSNYISTQWLSQADEDWYKKDIDLIKKSNLNAIRVHAHLERPEFYDVADEEGILIWQDYPLQWGYTDVPSFTKEALSQAKDMIEVFNNHPSIVLWCMHNESPHAMDWMEKKDPKQNLDLDNKLFELVKSMDSSRIVHRDSGTGDGHPYPGWYHGNIFDKDTSKLLDHWPMLTEYGAQALPCVDTLKTMFNEETLFPKTSSEWEIWKYSDFQPDQTFNLAKVSMGNDINTFVTNSQRYQANIIKYITERQRQLKWKKNTGLFHFMFIDDWPSITWSVVDYYRNPKQGYSVLQQTMQPLMPSIKYDIGNTKSPIEIILINDFHKDYKNLNVKWSTSNNKVKNIRLPIIKADSVQSLINLGTLAEVTEGNSILKVWIENHKGKIISENTLSKENFISEPGQRAK